MANFCGSCGAGLNPNAKFCSGCGLPINAAKPTCPTCGQEMPQQMANVSAPAVGYANAQVAPIATQTNTPVVNISAQGNSGFHLPVYGKEFNPGEHCGNCGFDVQDGKCSNCGTENLAPLT